MSLGSVNLVGGRLGGEGAGLSELGYNGGLAQRGFPQRALRRASLGQLTLSLYLRIAKGVPLR